MKPKEIVAAWVEAFNRGDADAMARLYTENAINHQVVRDPVSGRPAIREMFARDFAAAKMVCIVENIFEDGDWAILEWRDPLGLRGCGFFRTENGRIAFQRHYWDRLSFLKLHGLPVTEA
jgi:ketosteroid isomerase-like protein